MLIFVHELGHFVAAKLVGIEVQRFSIGFGPVVWGVTHGETEYVLSAIPLGGYVKMGGMDDEMMERIEGGAAEEERQPGPRDFDAKSIWARTFVISAGVIMNMVFAFAAYTAAAAFWGRPVMETTRVGDVAESYLPPGTEALDEVEPGARIVRVGEVEPEYWEDVVNALLDASPGPLAVEVTDPARTVEIRIPAGEEERRRLASAVQPWRDPGIGPVNPGSPADKGSLEEGDRILAVDGTPVETWGEFVRMIETRAGQRTEIRLSRDGREIVRVVTPDPTEEPDPVTGEERTVGKIGVYRPPDRMVYLPLDPLEAVEQGFLETVFITRVILEFLGDLVTGGISPRSVGSIGTIAEASGQAAAGGMVTFLRFMALFSINLAILNLLPIPILDGGHLLFLAIEAVRGKALSLEQRLRWSQVGFLIVMGLMVWALSNDVLRWLGL